MILIFRFQKNGSFEIKLFRMQVFLREYSLSDFVTFELVVRSIYEYIMNVLPKIIMMSENTNSYQF